ncbi:MAG TPA: DUF6159 family protein [Anaerolineales bacterium]|jgi:hypothetical protein|nr:DUF6159 family protein [Anaerolineales bacterium]
MFQKLANSWELVKASARVLQQDKELLVFPIISTIGVVLVTLGFIFPLLVGNLFDSIFSDDMRVVSFLVMLAYYVVQYAVIFFANTALVGAAMIRLEGGDPTVRDGLQIAARNFTSILGYALIAGTVGVILRMVSERSEGLGRLVISLIGTAWNIATYLVAPVLAVEGIGPVDAIKRSASLLKKTWGEQIAGNFGMGMITFLVIFGIILLGGAAVFGVVSLDLGVIPIVLVVGFVVMLIVIVGLISSTLNSIYTAAVYQYATTGKSGEFFESQLVENAFRRK